MSGRGYRSVLQCQHAKVEKFECLIKIMTQRLVLERLPHALSCGLFGTSFCILAWKSTCANTLVLLKTVRPFRTTSLI